MFVCKECHKKICDDEHIENIFGMGLSRGPCEMCKKLNKMCIDCTSYIDVKKGGEKNE